MFQSIEDIGTRQFARFVDAFVDTLLALYRLDAIAFHDPGHPVPAASLTDLPPIREPTTLPVDAAAGRVRGTDQHQQPPILDCTSGPRALHPLVETTG